MNSPLQRPAGVRGDLDAWLTLTADLLITAALLQSSLSHALGLSLPWFSVLVPALLTNSFAAYYARRNGLTALAFGPNTVFIVVFGRAVLAPRNLEWTAAGWTDAARLDASLSLLTGSLFLYAGIVALGVLAMVRWRPVLPRRALVIPLAAICWTHLVGTSLQSLAGEGLAVWLPALALFGLLFFTSKGPLTWVVALGLWVVLSWVVPPASSGSSLTLSRDVIPLSSALVGLDSFQALVSIAYWRDVFPLLAALGLANSFGVLENVAAAWEVGDRHSARAALFTATAGTLVGAVVGSAAPVTVYIGHPAFRAGGARWLYAALSALSLVPLLFALERGLLDWFPVAIFHGAIIYIGATVGLLPRRYLHDRRDLARAFLVASPILAGWLTLMLGKEASGLSSWLGNGGGLIAVGWGFLVFEDLSRRDRMIICLALATGSVMGLLHAPAGSMLAGLTGAAYVVLGLTLARSRGSEPNSVS